LGICQFSGFTLIELLVVCTILAAIALIAWSGYAGVEPRARDELARTQILTLAQALTRFHQDTGYWPGTGPFQLADADAADCAMSTGGAIAITDPDVPDWYASPANLTLLFAPPALCDGHPLAALKSWDADRGRGWNGPYLPLAARHWLDIGEDPEDPETGPALTNLPAFAAGPDFSAIPNLRWRALPSTSTGYDNNRHAFARHPRPLLFYPKPKPRVVYWGMDGRYGGENTVDPCLPNTTSPDGLDDSIVCL
jgi:prepilin-type N-terminal cleavage/methylation domain-containing protein